MFLTEAEQAANDQFTSCCSRSKDPQLFLDFLDKPGLRLLSYRLSR